MDSLKASTKTIPSRLPAAGVVGMSHTWWMNKHNRHHANPNTIGKDPDIEVDTISFLEEDAQTITGLNGYFAIVLWFLPLGLGFALLGAQLAIR